MTETRFAGTAARVQVGSHGLPRGPGSVDPSSFAHLRFWLAALWSRAHAQIHQIDGGTVNYRVQMEVLDALVEVYQELRRDGRQDVADQVAEVISTLCRELLEADGQPIPTDRLLEVLALVASILQLIKWW